MPDVPGRGSARDPGAAQGDRCRNGAGAARRAPDAGQRLPAGRYRFELDPCDLLALAARGHAGPAARTGDRRVGDRGEGQPDGRPDRRLAVRAPGRGIQAGRLWGSWHHRGPVRHQRRRHRRGQAGRADGDAVQARSAGPAGRPAPAGNGRAAGGRTPAAGSGRDLRRVTGTARRQSGKPGGPGKPRGGKEAQRAVTAPQVLIHRDAGLLARAAAARLVTRLVDISAARGHASLVLTGGGIGTRLLAELAAAPARDAVDWRHLDIWWGDERFVSTGDPERNETGARSALLDHVDVDPARVHPMPGPDGPDGDDPEAAAARYASWLAAATTPEDHGLVPSFDVLMLGIGPEGHVASLFPSMPALYDERPVVAVRGSPKPPPTRLSMTLPSIQAAWEIWILASGPDKANALAMALSDAGPVQVPAAGARGRQRTLFLIDSAAAAKVPAQIGRASCR